MLQKYSRVSVLDNSGAHYCQIIGYKKVQKYSNIGSVVIVSVKKLQRFIMHSKARKRTFKKMKTGQIFCAIICLVRFKANRRCGIVFQSFSNGVILLKKKSKNPLGNRIFGPLSLDLRLFGLSRLLIICWRVL